MVAEPRYSSSNTPNDFIKRSQCPRYSVKDIREKLRKLIKYYPKNFEAVKPITIEFSYVLSSLGEEEETELRRLFFLVVARYKREFLRHYNISLDCPVLPLWRKGGEIQSLNIYHNSGYYYQYIPSHTETLFSLKELFKVNKRLKILELDEKIHSIAMCLKKIKYIPSLTSISIENVSLAHLQDYKRLFLSSKSSLQSVSLTLKTFSKGLTDKMNQTLGEFFRTILELPRLKKFHFSSKDTDKFDINKIPFNVLKKRNIAYSIHIPQAQKLSISSCTEIGLLHLEFLGIHFKDLWLKDGTRWDKHHEDYLRAQENCKRVLILGLFDKKEVDLADLFRICRNITTLDIILSYRNTSEGISFAGLRNLHNLKNSFIEISSLGRRRIMFKGRDEVEYEGVSCSEDLFDSLTRCTHTLRSVHLHLYGEELTENKDKVLGFFRAYADILLNFTLKFTANPYGICQKIGIFYEGMRLLKRVESINMIYHQVYWKDTFAKHYEYLKSGIGDKRYLREFCIFTPFSGSNNVPVNYHELKGVNKLRLNFLYLDSCSTLFATEFSKLTHLELGVNKMDTYIWGRLLLMFDELKHLRILLLNCCTYKTNTKGNQNLIIKLRTLFMEKQNLSFLAVAIGQDSEEIKIFLKDSSLNSPSMEDLDSFFGQGSKLALKKQIYKKYFLS